MTSATNPRPKITRRGVLVGSATLALGGAAIFGANWFNITAQAGQKGALSAPEAHEAATAGSITLIDIRRPDEWARTGVGVGAVPINMLDRDFIDQLTAHVVGDTTVPVALICARGVRSRKMGARLTQAGFTNIIDVPEGMLGSGAGPGWVKRGLPVTKG
ncbi:rhodanese-like domain-containing protein [Pseudosulfitobacter sp. SM2401]|uniref:rhodanese-like domain-containing protein n=1 Tax=Pseudosulfitobacter sp. SM2401 TaxID=3350098 RepID=UPI0036F42F44